MVRYGSGRADRVDVAIRRHIITSMGLTAGELTLELGREYGINLVQVSSHLGARIGEGVANHFAWQGKVYSIEGGTKEHPNLQASTGYPGNPLGLHGYNCRHQTWLSLDGVTTQPTYDEDANALRYEQEQEQEQRRLERGIRAAKREVDVIDTAGGDSSRALLKVNRWQQRYKAYSAEHGLMLHSNRTQEIGINNRSISARATAAARRQAARDDYIKNVKPTLDRRASLPDTKLSETMSPSASGVAGVIPKGVTLTNVTIMAGYGTSTEFRDASRFAATYGGEDYKWTKVSGTAYGDNYLHDIHWNEYGGRQYEVKVKETKAR